MPDEQMSDRLQHALVLVMSVLVGIGLSQILWSLGYPPASVGLVFVAPPLLAWIAYRREWRRGLPDRSPGLTVAPGIHLPLLASTLVIGLLLRLHMLTAKPAWSDEMWTLRNTWPGDWAGILRVAADDFWPPLHYLILDVAARVGDIGIFTLRFPSVLFGVATIAALPSLGRSLLGSRRLGLIGAFFLTGLQAHVLYSQEARVYALVVLLVALSGVFFYRSLWEGKVSIGFVVVTTLLTYSHSFVSWYFVAAEWGYILCVAYVWGRRDLLRPALVSQGLVLALQLPLAAAFIYARLTRPIEVPLYWATGTNAPMIGMVELLDLYASLTVRSVSAILFQSVLYGLALRELVRPSLQGSGSGDSWDGMGLRRGIVFLLAWILVPVLFSLVVTLLTPLDTFGSWRYHITLLPAMSLLAAVGFVRLRSKTGVALACSLLVLIPAHELPDYYSNFNRPAFDEAASYVREHRTDSEMIRVGNGIRVFAYYYRGSFPRIGSEEWDTFVAEYAHLTDVYIFPGDFKSGNAISNERVPTFIQYVGRPSPDQWVSTEETRAPFWFVTHVGEGGKRAALDRLGCTYTDIAQFRDVDVRRCVPPDL